MLKDRPTSPVTVPRGLNAQEQREVARLRRECAKIGLRMKCAYRWSGLTGSLWYLVDAKADASHMCLSQRWIAGGVPIKGPRPRREGHEGTWTLNQLRKEVSKRTRGEEG